MAIQRNISSGCKCGSVAIASTEAPIFRAFCHCTICRAFNKTDYADVTIFHAKSVQPYDASNIEFKFFKKPFWVSRGCCNKCGQAVVETANVPLMPKLVIIPSSNFSEPELLPSPVMHIFYDKRVADIDDDLRKYLGYLPSQAGFGKELIKGLLSPS